MRLFINSEYEGMVCKYWCILYTILSFIRVIKKVGLKAIPVKMPEREIILRSKSENARKALDLIKVTYPGRILGSVPTEQKKN